MTSRAGHSYTNSYISGSSRAHLGDVYNHYGPSPDERAVQSVLESLRYDGMDDRRDRLSSAERGTFDWALAGGKVKSDGDVESHKADGGRSEDVRTARVTFTTWLEGSEEGLLCFMGKPGSGKSTLMYV